MEGFSEEHSKLLLSKEWLVKIEAAKSIPYLIKFYRSTVDLSTTFLITDTKSVWAEVLTSQQFARRWRQYNIAAPPVYTDTVREDSWRSSNLELLSNMHSLGGISDLSFDVVYSNFSDLAIEIEGEQVKWRWETCFLGYRQSAELISKHLIFPLISVNHLTLASPDVVSELSDLELEKAVDKVGRTARRTIDTHVKNALMKPRMATTIRRMTAMFNFVSDLPSINSFAEKPDLQPEEAEPTERHQPKAAIEDPHGFSSPPTSRLLPERSLHSHQLENVGKPAASPDSATEPEEGEPPKRKSFSPPIGLAQKETTKKPVIPMRSPSPGVEQKIISSQRSDSDSSPRRAANAKKPRLKSPSDDESDDQRNGRSTSAAAGSGLAKRGARQPIKRGGKRF